MTQLFSNNASTTISGAINSAVTTINVQTGDGDLFSSPTGSDFEFLTLHTRDYSAWEVVSLESRTDDALIVTRGIEGSALDWSEGIYLSANVTAKSLQDLSILASTAKTTADSAQADATDALAQLAALEGGGGGASTDPAVVLQLRVASVNATDGSGSEKLYYTFGARLGEHLTIRNTSTNYMPMPTLGYDRVDWERSQVYVNDALYYTYSDGSQTDWMTYASYGSVQILGPRDFRFYPALAVNDVVVVIAPRIPGVVSDNTKAGHEYSDFLYLDTGVINSYIGGGQFRNSGEVDEWNWTTHTSTILHTDYSFSLYLQYGSGATSNSAGTIFWFGGGSIGIGTNKVHKLGVDPLVNMVSTITMPADSTNGTAFTDRLTSWVVGFGEATHTKGILVFDNSLETSAVSASVLGGSNTDYITAICDETYGWVFNYMDDAGSITEAQFEKVTCATDAITVQADIGVGKQLRASSPALLFRDGSAFLWGGSSYSTHTWDKATDTVTHTSIYDDNISIYGTNSHSVVCDGEYEAQSTKAALFVKDSMVSITLRHRRNDDSGGWLVLSNNPVGAATDYWSAC